MTKFDIFVGRKDELRLIDEWINKWNTTHLIAVQGDGGVGKTWLLKEVQKRYQDRDDLVVVYWDYAEHHATGLSQIADLYRYLGIEKSRFLDALAELNQKAYDWVPDEVERKEKQLFQISVDELDPYLEEKRMIYLTDTTESMAVSTERADQYTSQLGNALVISAGRNVKQEKLATFNDVYGSQNVSLIELCEFDRVESAEFFSAVDVEGVIEPEMRAKLYFLTDGRPILLTLAVEWSVRNNTLSDIAERPLDELTSLSQDALRTLREQFEFELVNRVRDLKGMLNQAVLYMAHVNRRNDAHILSALFDISLPEAYNLVDQLAGLAFVKYNPSTASCLLHDEMKNLINKHVWPYIDPTGEIRVKLLHKVIETYYQPRIDELVAQTKTQLELDKGPVHRATISDAEWEQWRLEAECLYYHLQIGEKEGLAYFEARFAEAQRNNHLVRMQLLLSEMEIAGHTGIQDTFELRRAESLRLEGKLTQAADICHRMLARRGLSPENRISAYNVLGLIAALTDPEQAVRSFQSALKIARKQGQMRVMGVMHNNLGQIYSRTSHLDQAIQHYNQAIEYSRVAGNHPLVASATNNLAYIYRLQGNLSQADVLCRVALARRRRLGLERDLAYSYLTKGEIDRDRGDLEGAERYTKLALRSFDKVGEIRGQVMAYRSLSNIRRHMEQYEETEAYLERALLLADQFGDESLLASVFNVYGREQRDRAVYLQEINGGNKIPEIAAFFQNAQDYLTRSLDLASKYGDQWLIARAQFELALAYFLGRLRQDQEVADLLDQIWDKAARLGYTLLQGYIQETRGEIAERQHDYAAAAHHFGLAAQLISQQRGREPERFFDRLCDRFLNPRFSSDAIAVLAQGILDVIQGPDMDDSLQPLGMLCRQVLGFDEF
ncbi:MAG: tetratricopeptide repeat protein [Anaerolineae bacterium]|nr:tetratricopeptide repeat protein [Anaerolineae bacterium]